MNLNTVAIFFQEGGKLLTEIIRTRGPRRRMAPVEPSRDYPGEPTSKEVPESPTEERKATSIEAGCVPCAIGHLGTCSGLLAEGLRFGKKDGIQSGEVIDRVNLCLDELNTMERVDLRPEMMVRLPQWEKKLADQALTESRSTRHGLEGLKTIEDLEKVAANIQTVRQEIGRDWFKQKLSKMPKGEKTELVATAVEKIEKEA